MSGWSAFVRVAALRFRLSLRQRLGWMAVVAGSLSVIASMIFARVSYLNAPKIFWDFALGSSFILQGALAVYLSSQIFHDEKNRRTLHLLLAAGVPRAAWLVGNAVGLWLTLTAMNFAWLALTCLTSWLSFDAVPWAIGLESQVAVAAEMLIVVFAGIFLSLWVRAVLSFSAAAVVFVFLHSVGSIERIFTDPQSKRLIDAPGAHAMLGVAKVLPPLEWFDLRVFVGYQPSVTPGVLGALLALALMWSLLIGGLCVVRFDRMDL